MQNAQFLGARLRDLRQQRGLRQAQLADMAGLSASYLNLLEHGRRRISARAQQRLAQALQVSPEALSETIGADRVSRLQAAAQASGVTAARTEDLVVRHPDWSQVILDQAERLDVQQRQITALSDRLTHDPQLAAALHEVLSAVTSIRSTASILAQGGDLDADWQRRFHNNIFDDARRLAQSTSEMIGGLELREAEGLSAVDMAETYLTAHPELVTGRVELDDDALPAGAMVVLRYWLEQIRQDEAQLPLQQLAAPARACGYDPFALLALAGGDLALVLRRLAALSRSGDHPPMGIAICDGAGAVLFREPVEQIALPRGGMACPLWPIFTALSRPGQPVVTHARLDGGPRLRLWAVADLRLQDDPTQPPVVRAVMLIRPDPEPPEPSDLQVGPGCGVCARTDCAARRSSQVPAAGL